MMNETTQTNNKKILLAVLFHALNGAKETLQKESRADYVELDVVRHMFEDKVEIDTCWESLLALSHKGNSLLSEILLAMREWKEENPQSTIMTDQDRKHLRLT